jgi:hypothetical protein
MLTRAVASGRPLLSRLSESPNVPHSATPESVARDRELDPPGNFDYVPVQSARGDDSAAGRSLCFAIRSKIAQLPERPRNDLAAGR